MPINDSIRDFRALSSGLESLSKCENDKEIKENYETLKFITGADDIDSVIKKISDTLAANKSQDSQVHFHNIEAGLDVLRRNIHVLSNSERGFITKLFIRLFPHTEYSKNAVQKEHQRFLNTQFLYRVALGKEEKEVFRMSNLLRHNSSIGKAVSDATFRAKSASILTQYQFSKGSHGSQLSDLHQKVMQAYQENKQNKEAGKNHWDLDSIEDFYAAMLLGSVEHLHSPELGFLRDLSLNNTPFYDFHSHAAYTYISIAFNKIHGEEPAQSDVKNAEVIEEHYTSSSSNTKRLLSRASRRVITHKNDPEQGFDLMSDLIQSKDFQKMAAHQLNLLLQGSAPFKTRVSTYKKWIANETEQYYKNKVKEAIVNADTLTLFHASAWIAARKELDKDTLHQLESMLLLTGLVDPTEEESHTLSSILTGLSAATDIFAKLPREAA